MRKILFRGKRIDNGEWAYSQTVFSHLDNFYIPTQNLKCTVMRNLDTVGNISEIRCKDGKYFFKVHPETVGQFTGLTDKNGTRVFEGDILKIINKYQSPFDDDTNEYTDITTDVVHFDNEGLCFSYGKSPFLCVVDNVTAEYEVIGNIHDNPKLLNNFKNQ